MKCTQVEKKKKNNNNNKAVTYRTLRPQSCHLASYFKHTSFSSRRGVQTRCHKYSTRPLWPSRSLLQEVVPSVRCLQRVFLRTTLKAACV